MYGKKHDNSIKKPRKVVTNGREYDIVQIDHDVGKEFDNEEIVLCFAFDDVTFVDGRR